VVDWLLSRCKAKSVAYLKNDDIKDIWAYQFPRRGDGGLGHRYVLLALIRIVKERSGAQTPAETAAAAARFGIPLGEWYEFQSEL
jgi:hypothetical protein